MRPPGASAKGQLNRELLRSRLDCVSRVAPRLAPWNEVSRSTIIVIWFQRVGIQCAEPFAIRSADAKRSLEHHQFAKQRVENRSTRAGLKAARSLRHTRPPDLRQGCPIEQAIRPLGDARNSSGAKCRGNSRKHSIPAVLANRYSPEISAEEVRRKPTDDPRRVDGCRIPLLSSGHEETWGMPNTPPACLKNL